jgi:hypothetical protein
MSIPDTLWVLADMLFHGLKAEMAILDGIARRSVAQDSDSNLAASGR